MFLNMKEVWNEQSHMKMGEITSRNRSNNAQSRVNETNDKKFGILYLE